MVYKKIYWIIQQSSVYGSDQLDRQIERLKDVEGRSGFGWSYFIRPENKLGGL